MKTALVLACAVLAATPCIAATAAAPAPVQTNEPQIQNFGDWDVRCFPVKSASPCDAYFATVRKQTGQRVSSVSIAYVPAQDRYVMQVAAPLGLSIPDGLVIKAGSFSTGKLQFRRCDQGGCYVETEIDNKLIDSLKKADGSESNIGVVSADGKTLALPLSFKGFGDAIADLINQARARANGS